MAEDDVNRGLPAGVDPARVEARRRAVARRAAATGAVAVGGAPSRLPPGQTAVRKWPRLDLGVLPEIDAAAYSLRIVGAVVQPLEFSLADLAAMPQTRSRQDFHCVTGWSRLDLDLGGVAVADLLERVGVRPEAAFVLARGADGYTTNVPLSACASRDVLLVTHWQGAPLPAEHGGPLRMVTPQLWAWKGAKWLTQLELSARDKPGFWERRGYSNSALPWQKDRFAGGVPPDTYAVEVPEDAEPFALEQE